MRKKKRTNFYVRLTAEHQRLVSAVIREISNDQLAQGTMKNVSPSDALRLCLDHCAEPDYRVLRALDYLARD